MVRILLQLGIVSAISFVTIHGQPDGGNDVLAAVPSRVAPTEQIKVSPKLFELQAIQRAERNERLQLQRELYSKWRKSQEWQTFLRRTAAGKTRGATKRDRYLASTFVGGFGYPTRIGPNALDKQPLGYYIKIQSGISLPADAPEPRHLSLDESLDGLLVTVKPNQNNDLTFQEILWEIIEKYHLSFEMREGDVFHITKHKQAPPDEPPDLKRPG